MEWGRTQIHMNGSVAGIAVTPSSSVDVILVQRLTDDGVAVTALTSVRHRPIRGGKEDLDIAARCARGHLEVKG